MAGKPVITSSSISKPLTLDAMRYARRQPNTIRRQKQTGAENTPPSPFFRKAIQRKEEGAPKAADDQLKDQMKDQNKETEKAQKKVEEPEKDKDKTAQTKVEEKEPAGETKLPK